MIGQNLTASVSGTSGAVTGISSILHDLVADLAQELGLLESDMDVYFPVDLESGSVPMAVVASAAKSSEHVFGVCRPVTMNSFTTDAFGVMAQSYLMKRGKDPMEVDISKVSIKLISIVKQPEHGQFVMLEGEYGSAKYTPDKGYLGKDRVEVIVSVGDEIIRIVCDFVVQQKATDSLELGGAEWNELCPKGIGWIISELSAEDYPDLANWYGAASLQSLLTGAKDALTGFTDLSGASLGQTTGSQITLDADAASHGWFIDATPYLNEEWLPTSNPYEWQAKPGSEAEGKMDLLSVLLHEYGHVLGLEHSADQHDAMAATLQPGVRRH
ncbi:MAG: matrixin family metalloprotease [Azoarcus sp.]|nr:matrixin family metalloprotease [Azoarcus sp.]